MALGILLFLIYSIISEENQTTVNKTGRYIRRAKKPSAKTQQAATHSHSDGGCGGGMCAKDAPINVKHMKHTDEV